MLIPTFEIGCKRRIFDSGYLESLHSDNLTLTNKLAVEILANGVQMDDGFIEADVIVLANGYTTNTYLGGIDVIGRNGSLKEHWKTYGGAEAYNCSSMSGFPNFFMILGRLSLCLAWLDLYSNLPQDRTLSLGTPLPFWLPRIASILHCVSSGQFYTRKGASWTWIRTLKTAMSSVSSTIFLRWYGIRVARAGTLRPVQKRPRHGMQWAIHTLRHISGIVACFLRGVIGDFL
jgi:hypothetical protein